MKQKMYDLKLTREDAVLINSAVQVYVATAKKAFSEGKVTAEYYCEILEESNDFFDRFRTVAEQIHEDIKAREAEKNE